MICHPRKFPLSSSSATSSIHAINARPLFWPQFSASFWPSSGSVLHCLPSLASISRTVPSNVYSGHQPQCARALVSSSERGHESAEFIMGPMMARCQKYYGEWGQVGKVLISLKSRRPDLFLWNFLTSYEFFENSKQSKETS